MQTSGDFESWSKNFKAAVDNVLADCPDGSHEFAGLLAHLNDFFWSRFNEPKNIEGFSDAAFFKELAISALCGASVLSGKPVQEVGMACYDLGVRKNKDYGSDNILRFGTMGLIVRIGDKINRLNNLYKSGTAQVADEKMLDTLMDVFNYSIYGIMLSNGIWF
ncbi:MAG: nucleotide modification associated domain-containing protein [Candidatus Micrarchaeia archaeon]